MDDEIDHLWREQLDWDAARRIEKESNRDHHSMHHRTSESIFEKHADAQRPQWSETSRLERIIFIAALVTVSSVLAYTFVSISAEQAKMRSESGLRVHANSPRTDASRP